MAGLFRQATINFDQLFEAGSGPTAPNMRAGAPLQYAARTAPKRADVGYRVGGSDVSNLWQPTGVVPPARLPFDGQSVFAGVTGLSGETGTISSTAGMQMLANGTYQGVAFSRGPGVNQLSGTWLPAGHAVSDYEVRFVFGAQGGTAPPASNGAPNYVASTTQRNASISASVDAATQNTQSGSIAVTVQLRRISTGVITEGTVTLFASAQGQV